MPLNIIADFFGILSVGLLNSISTLLVISFIIWELPRSIKLISEDYTKGLYPEYGRVVDFFLLGIGLLCLIYLQIDRNSENVITFLKTPGITAFFLILIIVIPIIIILGYLRRIFGRMESNNSITAFLTQAFLDLMHTIFYICLSSILIPIVGYLILGLK